MRGGISRLWLRHVFEHSSGSQKIADLEQHGSYFNLLFFEHVNRLDADTAVACNGSRPDGVGCLADTLWVQGPVKTANEAYWSQFTRHIL